MPAICKNWGRRTKRYFVGALIIGTGVFLCLQSAQNVEAEAPAGDVGAVQTCVVCHATPGLKMQLVSGEILSAQVQPEAFSKSAHGNLLQCTACHSDIQDFPHQARNIFRPSARDIPFLIRSYTGCGGCHKEEYTQYLASAHARALNAGKSDSAVCTDCHGVHNIEFANPSEVGLALAPAVYNCGKCHKEEFEQYRNSVHGKDLLDKGDPNVPACVDCHGVHGMDKAKDASGFRQQSIALCASCHANEKLMQKYGLSTQILSTYVADFHGTTAQLFPPKTGRAPDQAMCYDCHGVHDIQGTVASSGLALQENLLTACQKCHKEATSNFPAAWLGHHDPTPNQAALVFWIRGIYNVLVTATILLLVGHITLDIGRVLLNTLHGGHPADE